MAGFIDLEPGLVEGLVPELKDPDTFDFTHTVAAGNDRLLHIFHESVMVGFGNTNYDDRVIEAVDTGAKAYESLSIIRNEPIPAEYAVEFIAENNKNGNFGLELAGLMDEARGNLMVENPELAMGMKAICVAHLDDKSDELAFVYGVGGGALLRLAHQGVHEAWELEQALRSS